MPSAPSAASLREVTVITELPPRENVRPASLIRCLSHAGAPIHQHHAPELDLL
ncbi:hypothetical protein [Deinococcus knuensis]|uniref:Uncharacterized protein n=1 Tax=Deinococcus knuensis TaxID=1837380 RepID=A0ABQ2SPV7_9DEIO|nr:hypothetical protein [Deinococcus knuensis]GGS36595.1 hypothetical protein GCM10008961_30410 [Deinococcus knuensis]